MKILFINTSDIGGGAATAMHRLAVGLKRQHHTQNYFIVRTKKTTDKHVYEVRTKLYEKVVERVLEKFERIIGLPYTFLPLSSRNILTRAKKIRPDIISLHNIHGAYFQTSVLPELSRIAPIVWTFHDMWPVTRNAAHTFGDKSWKFLHTFKAEKKIYPEINIDTGNYLMKWKKSIYAKTKMAVVVPSKWMATIANESPMLKGKKVFQVYHGIDLNVFKPGNKEDVRKKLGLPLNKKIIMFGADFLQNNPFKGGKLLRDILTELDRKLKEDVVLLVVGKSGNKLTKEYKRLRVISPGRINNEKIMALYYQASDCFINPTKADSLSLVLVESLICGTPAVSYDVGGTGEVIKNALSGYLIKPFNYRKFSESVLNMLKAKNRGITPNITVRNSTARKFDLTQMVNHYYDIFINIKNYV